MFTTVTKYDFMDAFQNSQYKSNFSYEGLSTLFDYLEDLGAQMGEQIEMNVTDIACSYTEYDSLEELREDYPNEDYELFTRQIEIVCTATDLDKTIFHDCSQHGVVIVEQ